MPFTRKDKYKLRQQKVEPPFGTINRHPIAIGWGFDYVLLKGLKKNEADFGLIFSVYNTRRVLTNVSGNSKMTRNMRHRTKVLTVIFLIVLTDCNQNSETDKQKAMQLDKNKKLRLLTYGFPPDMEYQSAENVIADKWGIEYFSVAGCFVTSEQIDSVDKNNKEVEVLIENKYGKSWQTTFYKEVEEELIKQKIASSLLDKEKIIFTKRKDLEKEGNGLDYCFQPINKSEYKVSAAGWGQINGKDEYVSYYRYFVDIEYKKVKLIGDSLMKMNYRLH